MDNSETMATFCTTQETKTNNEKKLNYGIITVATMI